MSALTKDSLMEAARVRATAAKRQVTVAKADLAAANTELDVALAEGRTAKVRVAREHTRSAETAVVEAAKEIKVVEHSLDVGPPKNATTHTSA